MLLNGGTTKDDRQVWRRAILSALIGQLGYYRIDEVGFAAVDSHLNVSEPKALLGPTVHRYYVIVYCPPWLVLLRVVKDQPASPGAQLSDFDQRLPPSDATEDLENIGRKDVRIARPGAIKSLPVGAAVTSRKLDDPRAGPRLLVQRVAQDDAAGPQPQIARIEIGGSQHLVGQPDRPSDEGAEVW